MAEEKNKVKPAAKKEPKLTLALSIEAIVNEIESVKAKMTILQGEINAYAKVIDLLKQIEEE